MHSGLALVLAAAMALLAVPVQVQAARDARCFVEPFPRLLENHIANERQCGLNNPHVINWVCEPVHGLVPDAVLAEFAAGSPATATAPALVFPAQAGPSSKPALARRQTEQRSSRAAGLSGAAILGAVELLGRAASK